MSEEKELYDDKNDDVTAETETEETEEVTEESCEAEENSEEAETEEKSEEKKGFFKKKKDKKDEKIEELTDRVKRQMAEFDNFRKRTEKEKASMYETGAREIIEKILPVVDNFERGLAAVPEEEKDAILEEFDKAQMETKVLSRGANPPMLHSKIDKATARFVPAFAI